MVHFPFWKNILIKTDQIKTKPLGAVFSFSPEHNGRKCSPLRLHGINFFHTFWIFRCFCFFVLLYSYLFGFDYELVFAFALHNGLKPIEVTRHKLVGDKNRHLVFDPANWNLTEDWLILKVAVCNFFVILGLSSNSKLW